jgi:hypothetical protein
MGGASFQVFKFFQVQGRSFFCFFLKFFLHICLDVNHLFVVYKVYFSYIVLFFSYIIFCKLCCVYFAWWKEDTKVGYFSIVNACKFFNFIFMAYIILLRHKIYIYIFFWLNTHTCLLFLYHVAISKVFLKKLICNKLMFLQDLGLPLQRIDYLYSLWRVYGSSI